MTPGCRFGVHKHYAPVEFFVLKGGFGYEAGIARKWGYGVEGAPSVHEPICEDGEEMVMLAFSHGGYQMFNEDGSLGKVFDATDFMALARANNALAAVERAASVHPLAWLDRQSTRTGKLGG
jgi:hypothetical protein